MAGRMAKGLGLITGVTALAAGGIAAGLELERRIVAKRILRASSEDSDKFFALRADGPKIITPDGVVLHTEIDEVEGGAGAGDPTLVFVHGYALNLDCWHFQRRHFRGRYRQVFYDLRSHGRSSRSDRQHCRIPQLADDLAQILDDVVGDRPAILIGHSMGGMTIMRLVQTEPERFGGPDPRGRGDDEQREDERGAHGPEENNTASTEEKRRRQSELLKITTSGAPLSSSVRKNQRPRCGLAPSTSRNGAVT